MRLALPLLLLATPAPVLADLAGQWTCRLDRECTPEDGCQPAATPPFALTLAATGATVTHADGIDVMQPVLAVPGVAGFAGPLARSMVLSLLVQETSATTAALEMGRLAGAGGGVETQTASGWCTR